MNSWNWTGFGFDEDDEQEANPLVELQAEGIQCYANGHTLEGVEVFAAGCWNQDCYDEGDLDSMVDAFEKVGFRPPVKLGHDSKSGDRAYGWVKKIYRKGKKLFADLVDIPPTSTNSSRTGVTTPSLRRFFGT